MDLLFRVVMVVVGGMLAANAFWKLLLAAPSSSHHRSRATTMYAAYLVAGIGISFFGLIGFAGPLGYIAFIGGTGGIALASYLGLVDHQRPSDHSSGSVR